MAQILGLQNSKFSLIRVQTLGAQTAQMHNLLYRPWLLKSLLGLRVWILVKI